MVKNTRIKKYLLSERKARKPKDINKIAKITYGYLRL
jgi:hypothetical protein